MAGTPDEIDLTPDVLNLSLWEGDGWAVEVTLTNPDDTPINLTGAVIKGTIAPDVEMEIVDGDLAAGVFYFGQEAAGAKGKYDVQVTLPGGRPRTYVTGKIKVTADITPP